MCDADGFIRGDRGDDTALGFIGAVGIARAAVEYDHPAGKDSFRTLAQAGAINRGPSAFRHRDADRLSVRDPSSDGINTTPEPEPADFSGAGPRSEARRGGKG